MVLLNRRLHHRHLLRADDVGGAHMLKASAHHVHRRAKQRTVDAAHLAPEGRLRRRVRNGATINGLQTFEACNDARYDEGEGRGRGIITCMCWKTRPSARFLRSSSTRCSSAR